VESDQGPACGEHAGERGGSVGCIEQGVLAFAYEAEDRGTVSAFQSMRDGPCAEAEDMGSFWPAAAPLLEKVVVAAEDIWQGFEARIGTRQIHLECLGQ
jgi:hypothetical protein